MDASVKLFSSAPNGRISYRVHARDVNLVMGPKEPAAPGAFRVSIHGEPPRAAFGSDADTEGAGLLDQQRMYQPPSTAGGRSPTARSRSSSSTEGRRRSRSRSADESVVHNRETAPPPAPFGLSPEDGRSVGQRR